ncbi:MAG TPA: cytochrome c [Terriglobales bacterium]|nr:cytochrome c [Terriglobales bacterium]
MNGILRKIANRNGLTTAVLALTLVVLAGCRQDMHDQPKFKPLAMNSFYPDDRSARPLVEGTVAREDERADQYFYTGKINGQPGNELPFPLTQQVLERGRERYNIYCSPCHSEIGDGNGMIVQRGFKRPPSYHTDRLRQAPIGHFFDVMTNGFGGMSEYKAQISPADRWSIAAYIRALQLSQNASRADLPAGTEMGNAPNMNAIPGTSEIQPQPNQRPIQGQTRGQTK